MWIIPPVRGVSVVSLTLVFLAAGLAGCGSATKAVRRSSESTTLKSKVNGPPQPGTGDFDWIQFKNGEWLKGEIEELQDEDFSFESDELDTLQIDWKDDQALEGLPSCPVSTHPECLLRRHRRPAWCQGSHTAYQQFPAKGRRQ